MSDVPVIISDFLNPRLENFRCLWSSILFFGKWTFTIFFSLAASKSLTITIYKYETLILMWWSKYAFLSQKKCKMFQKCNLFAKEHVTGNPSWSFTVSFRVYVTSVKKFFGTVDCFSSEKTSREPQNYRYYHECAPEVLLHLVFDQFESIFYIFLFDFDDHWRNLKKNQVRSQ